ncbi:tyrosine phosphatase family-domain-containing protein [Gaertneriomyces semiglobifer]|nr:tyrosine phosphatase family-domain-containing protein [Gaertneriomyces semiglobifer]
MPSELPPLYPPFRYGLVEEDLYRGAYPKPRNFRFLRRLGLRSILSLTPEPPNEDLTDFCKANNITPIFVRVDKPKEHIPLSFSKTAQILSSLIDATNLPLFVHCLDGTGVTGAIIMCLRKLQCWSLTYALVESARYHKDGVIGSEEAEFVEKFSSEVEVPQRIPKWLWAGQTNFKKHPSVKLKWPAQPIAVASKPTGPESSQSGAQVSTEELRGNDSSVISGSNTKTEELGLSNLSPQERRSRRPTDPQVQPRFQPLPVSASDTLPSYSKDDIRRDVDVFRRRVEGDDAIQSADISPVGMDDEVEEEDENLSMTLQALALEMSFPKTQKPA